MPHEDMTFALNRFLARIFRHCMLDLSQPATVRLCARLLAAGEVMVMFPQGRLTTPGSALKVYRSAAAIARRIVQVVELPRLGSGKTDYVMLKTLAGMARPKRVESRTRPS